MGCLEKGVCSFRASLCKKAPPKGCFGKVKNAESSASNSGLQFQPILCIVGTEKVVNHPLLRDQICRPNIVVLHAVFSHQLSCCAVCNASQHFAELQEIDYFWVTGIFPSIFFSFAHVLSAFPKSCQWRVWLKGGQEGYCASLLLSSLDFSPIPPISLLYPSCQLFWGHFGMNNRWRILSGFSVLFSIFRTFLCKNLGIKSRSWCNRNR